MTEKSLDYLYGYRDALMMLWYVMDKRKSAIMKEEFALAIEKKYTPMYPITSSTQTDQLREIRDALEMALNRVGITIRDKEEKQ